jgi:hypothetical protein
VRSSLQHSSVHLCDLGFLQLLGSWISIVLRRKLRVNGQFCVPRATSAGAWELHPDPDGVRQKPHRVVAGSRHDSSSRAWAQVGIGTLSAYLSPHRGVSDMWCWFARVIELRTETAIFSFSK